MFTLVGIVTNTHGIKGGLKVYPYTYDINRFREYKEVYIGEDKEVIHIENVSTYKNLVILTFKEFDNINQVLKYKDAEIYIKDEDRKALEDDKYYIADLVGCKVYDEEGIYYGDLTEVYTGIANDVYHVEGPEKSGDIPAVKDIILNIDTTNKKIIIKAIKGLFEWELMYWHFFLNL